MGRFGRVLLTMTSILKSNVHSSFRVVFLSPSFELCSDFDFESMAFDWEYSVRPPHSDVAQHLNESFCLTAVRKEDGERSFLFLIFPLELHERKRTGMKHIFR